MMLLFHFEIQSNGEVGTQISEYQEILNRFLVDVFHEILKTEERCLAGAFTNLSLRELHLIEEVCLAQTLGRDNRATAIAAAQKVTAGTLTTAVTLLEKKGYLERQRNEKDRRSVRILPTDLAWKADAIHATFHREMVEELVKAMKPEETELLARTLGNLAHFFKEKYEQRERIE